MIGSSQAAKRVDRAANSLVVLGDELAWADMDAAAERIHLLADEAREIADEIRKDPTADACDDDQ